MALNNVNDVQKVLREKAEAVLQEVSEWVYKTLIDCIQEAIYDVPETWYKRAGYNGGFIGAFELGVIKKSANILTRDLLYNYNKMKLGTNNGYTHGDMSAYIDRRKDLWWILDSREWNDVESEFGGAIGLRDGSAGYLETFYAYMQRDFWNVVDKICARHNLIRLR